VEEKAKSGKTRVKKSNAEALSANINETLTPLEFSVEGE